MLPSILIIVAVFVGVVAMIVCIAMLIRDKSVLQMEDRLCAITGKGDKKDLTSLSEAAELVTVQRNGNDGLEAALARWFNLTLLFEQAEVAMSLSTFFMICVGVGVGAASLCGVAGLHLALAPIVGIAFGFLPVFWLLFRRKRRLKKFAAQLSDALELISRALRAGHSLAAGFHLVAQEMSAPVSV